MGTRVLHPSSHDPKRPLPVVWEATPDQDSEAILRQVFELLFKDDILTYRPLEPLDNTSPPTDKENTQ